ncbi:MAG: acetate--CoA ligase alpha subunit [Candidatus Caldarchaeales archaeon]
MSLQKFFYPNSIAVIGASRNPDSVGHAIMRNLVNGQFTGVIYPVNPKARAILGIKAYPNVSSIPDEIDLAVVVVPNRAAPQVIEECVEVGIRSAVIISAGFKETGPEGAKLEEEVVSIAKRGNLRIIGPNCLGIINADPKVRMNVTFAREMPLSGQIALISQSGALCVAALEYARQYRIGFSKVVSLGNKADVNEIDVLEYLKDDSESKTILMYVEDLSHGRRFIETVRYITGEVGKPVIAIKAGRTLEGASAASSHTGALASSDEVYEAIFNQSGVLRVESIEELFNYAKAFSTQPLPKGDRVAIISNAGGPAILATDAVIRNKLRLAQFSEDTIKNLRAGLSPAASVKNPVDLIGDADHSRYEHALKHVLNDGNVDAVIVILTPQAMTTVDEIARVVVDIAPKYNKPVLTCFMGVSDISSSIEILENSRIPNFNFPEDAVRSLAALYKYGEWVTRPRTGVRTFIVHRDRAEDIIKRALSEGRRYLPDVEALEVLECYGFKTAKMILAKNPEEAVEAAEKIGYPVVMKIASPDIIHKFDIGGVRIRIENAEEVKRVFDEIVNNVRKHAPQARIWGVSVQEMVRDGLEVIFGVKRDPLFGPVVMFGLGGIYVEAYKDVSFRLAPIRELSAYHMIEDIRAKQILKGYRGGEERDIDAVAEGLMRLSQLSLEQQYISELDANPVMVFEKGRGYKVVDARIVLREKNSK